MDTLLNFLVLFLSRRMACKQCRKVKQKCVGGPPCARCVFHGKTCIPHTPRPVKSKKAKPIEPVVIPLLYVTWESAYSAIEKHWTKGLAQEIFPTPDA